MYSDHRDNCSYKKKKARLIGINSTSIPFKCILIQIRSTIDHIVNKKGTTYNSEILFFPDVNMYRYNLSSTWIKILKRDDGRFFFLWGYKKYHLQNARSLRMRYKFGLVLHLPESRGGEQYYNWKKVPQVQ